MTIRPTETPRILLTSVSKFLAQFSYSQFDQQTLIEKGVIHTSTDEYKPENIRLSAITPSNEVLALYLALIFAQEHQDSELCTIIQMIIKRDQAIETTNFPQTTQWMMYLTKIFLLEHKLVYAQVKML